LPLVARDPQAHVGGLEPPQQVEQLPTITFVRAVTPASERVVVHAKVGLPLLGRLGRRDLDAAPFLSLADVLASAFLEALEQLVGTTAQAHRMGHVSAPADVADHCRLQRQGIVRVQAPDQIFALGCHEPFREPDGVRGEQGLFGDPSAIRGFRRAHIPVEQAFQLGLEAQGQHRLEAIREADELGCGPDRAPAVALPDLGPFDRVEECGVLAGAPDPTPLLGAGVGNVFDSDRHGASSEPLKVADPRGFGDPPGNSWSTSRSRH
jgi:hypothetical protein